MVRVSTSSPRTPPTAIRLPTNHLTPPSEKGESAGQDQHVEPRPRRSFRDARQARKERESQDIQAPSKDSVHEQGEINKAAKILQQRETA